jgi:F-type H+-transporting ATPase subunit delta
MKITVTQYAKTLYESVKDEPKSQISRIISKFIKILAKNNQLNNSEKIIDKFNDIYNKENGIVEAEITSREVLSNMLNNKLKSFLQEKYKAKEIVLQNIVDEKIKGGIVIKVGDELMDASVAKQLKDLKNKLSN